MFALVRHAGYRIGSGSLTPEGQAQALVLAKALSEAGTAWTEIRTSPTSRTRETAAILAKELSLKVIEDQRISVDGELADLLPPTEPHGIIFVSHLPVLNRMLRAWSGEFGQEEPGLTEIAGGFLIDTAKKKIISIGH